MAKRRAHVLLTDLDNTLWDWFEIWYRPFSVMLAIVVERSGIAQDILEREIREVHQRYRTSEYAFLIESLPSLQAKHPGQNLSALYDDAIHAFRSERKRVLKLYDGVAETLHAVKSAGAVIAAYTESQAFYTSFRLRRTGLDGVIDYLYSPEDHELPDERTKLRLYDEEEYGLIKTVQRHTAPGELKPNPRILADILRYLEMESADAVYVGDSKMKDVLMAQQAGVFDVWAKYGIAQNRPAYELLRRVSHWSDADVSREKMFEVEPALTLEHSFSELLDHVEFF
jgi:phosphoglycolate phosphatase